MDTYTMSLFVSLSETLNFARTSELCGMSPSAVSRQIGRLEEEVGKPLFFRNTRTVELTAAGEELRAYAKSVLAGLEQIKERFHEGDRNLSGDLSLYASVTACYAVLPEILRKMRSRHPGVHIRLMTGDAALAVDSVRNGRVDLAVAAMPEALPGNMAFFSLVETPLLFFAPGFPCPFSPCLEAVPIPWESVPMILPVGDLARKRVDAWFRTKGIRPSVYAEVSGNEAILAMVSLGCGVGIVPELVARMGPMGTEVAAIPVEPALEPYRVGLCVLKRNLQAPLVRALWDCAAETMGGGDS